MTPAAKILLVGCGKMGGALLQRTMGATPAFAAEAVVVDPTPLPEKLKSLAHVTWFQTAEDIPATFEPDLVVLAVKPQYMPVVLPFYARYSKSVFLSIAAGLTCRHLMALLNQPNVALVRTMPNLPASIGHGITVAVGNLHVDRKARELCDMFLQSVGETAWIENEDLLDAVTALSGSGPAYVFALCEAMTEAGKELGLTAELAERLARQTVIGSGYLLESVAESAANLRQAVISPGGTTEAALAHLLSRDGLAPLMQKSMKAAEIRAKELAGAAHDKKPKLT